MAEQRLLRFEDRAGLVGAAAGRLLDEMCARQTAGRTVSLCLTGGTLAGEVYDELARQAPVSALRAGEIELWWNWDYFVATDNPDRNSLQALSRLAGVLPFDPAKIHPIPSSSVTSDPEAGAAQYAQELRETRRIDICLLELGEAGQVAGLFPGHPYGPSDTLVAGLSDAPLAHPQVVTMTPAGLAMCRQVWILATGEAVAGHVKAGVGLHCNLPSADLSATKSVLWLVDAAAASELPFHHCTL